MKPKKMFEALYKDLGPQHWWPASTAFEVCVGAILTQNTSWQNVEKAVKNLRSERMLSLAKIASADNRTLARLIKPSGYFNQKAVRLKKFCQYIEKNYNGSLKEFFDQPLPELREELVSLYGIGEETADSMLLYAAKKPSFVVDAYTKRIVNRVYGTQLDDYNELKEFFEDELPKSTRIYNEFHALLVEHGKVYCTKQAPKCHACPMQKECVFGKKSL